MLDRAVSDDVNCELGASQNDSNGTIPEEKKQAVIDCGYFLLFYYYPNLRNKYVGFCILIRS